MPTWDLTVEGTHEYVANGILVHNTFQSVRDEAVLRRLPIRSWCFREVLRTPDNPTGWMDPEFIERKRASVPAEMFRVEYELGEPSGTARAIDLDALNRSIAEVPLLRGFEKANDSLQVFEEPVPHGLYATGADWAKESDRTVITTWRTDVQPHRLVHLRSMNRKPWPEMIRIFNEAVTRYNGYSAHDATGIGNVVGDLIDERTLKFVMVGRNRTLMLSEYIAALERGDYAIPRAAAHFLLEHKAATVQDVYRTETALSTGHLPDSVASAALGHRAATRAAHATGGIATPRVGDPSPAWMDDLQAKPEDGRTEVVSGMVVQVPEPESIGVFWLE